MTFIIEEVTDPRTEYPPGDSPDVVSRMLPLYNYLNTAEKVINKYAPRHLRKSMLRSEDAVSYVANYMMKGDWTYDKSKTPKPSTRRISYGIFGVIEYCKNISKKRHTRSLDSGERPMSNFLAAYTAKYDHNDVKSRYLSNLMMVLTPAERRCIDMHFFQNMSISEVAKQLNIKQQAVQQSIKRGIESMRGAAGV
jgi:RNA polymerase sigma factor (sigma-70 family)